MKCVVIRGRVELDTEMSVLMDVGGTECVWIPKSVLSDEEGISAIYLNFTPGEEAEWIVDEWWAKYNGFN